MIFIALCSIPNNFGTSGPMPRLRLSIMSARVSSFSVPIRVNRAKEDETSVSIRAYFFFFGIDVSTWPLDKFIYLQFLYAASFRCKRRK